MSRLGTKSAAIEDNQKKENTTNVDFVCTEPLARRTRMKTNTLVIGDTEYWMNAPYRKGAQDCREGVPYGNAPYIVSDNIDQYNYGHENEGACEHIRNGIDVILAPLTGERFDEDPSVPRDRNGQVDDSWYADRLSEMELVRYEQAGRESER